MTATLGSPRVLGRAAVVVVLLVAAVTVPRQLSPSLLDILVLAAIYSIFAIGLDILMGYTGLDSLGQAAFFGTAAYALGILTVKHDLGWFAAAAVGLVLCVVLSAAFGLLAVRVRGLYFLLITLALGQLLWGAAQRWGDLTGGFNGLTGVAAPLEALSDPVNFAYAALALFVIVLVLARVIVSSPFGLALQGCRDQESRMRVLGFRSLRLKWLAFVLAAMMAGVAGLLNASYTGFVSPTDVSLQTSFAIMLMVIIGGAGHVYGAVIGAVAITVLQYELSIYLPEWWLIVLGAIYMLTTAVLPNGVVGAAVARRGRPHRDPDPLGSAKDHDHRGSLPSVDAADRSPRPAQDPDAAEVLVLAGLNKHFGGFSALKDVSLRFRAGERTAIIGPNGAGKTTLFNVITGVEPASRGSITVFGVDVTSRPPMSRPALGLARTFQVTRLFAPLTVMDNMMLGLLGWTERTHQYTMWRRTRGMGELQARAEHELQRCGLADVRHEIVSTLSYGHQKQLDIALALASSPKLLLLDEPTAGLSESEARRMMTLVEDLPASITVVIIEHNLDFVFRLTDRAVVLDHGQVLMDGPQAQIRQSEEVQRIYFGSAVV